MKMSPVWSRRLRMALVLGVALVVLVGVVAWYKLLRQVPQEFQSEDMRFKYGSLRSESDRGIPYWVWVVLPRIFPDLLPGPGGYASLGIAWEPGQEMPVGFSKKTVGFPRVTNNCAVCHTARYRVAKDNPPVFVTGGPAHTSNIQENIRFLTRCAKEPRFNADVLLDEISRVYGLSWLDRQIYRHLIIPLTKKALLEQDAQFAWMEATPAGKPKPAWGPGRDDPMNLTKYFMTGMDKDDTVGQADFPSIWNLKIRKPPAGKEDDKAAELLLNWSGDTPSARSVLIDSALGLGAPPDQPFLKRIGEIESFLTNMPPPPFPKDACPEQKRFCVDGALVAAGAPVYEKHCAECHEPGRKWTSKVIPIADIGTDRERMDTWSQAAADQANRKVRDMGIPRKEMVKNFGYVSPPLDGIWLRAPYLHNGSVPDMRALLEPVAGRPRWFVRGYDVYDPEALGFESNPCALGFKAAAVPDKAAAPGADKGTTGGTSPPCDLGFAPDRPVPKEGDEGPPVGVFLYDAQERGNGNGGHLYGIELTPAEKKALLEYLKTL